ncbi:MAG: hypothetical protein EBT59_12580 [Betaproteobacteria bacterium]|nr:hypothetical protein [Betaproteobacteria bacterium]
MHHTTMLKQELLKALASIEGLTAEPSAVSGGIALFFRGCEFAHFHNDNELDLRLTKKVIQAQGIAHPTDSTHHPDRSPSSPWIEVRFTNSAGRLRKLGSVAVKPLPLVYDVGRLSTQ